MITLWVKSLTLPHPGGPQRIILGISCFSSAWRRIAFLFRTCVCPMKFSNVSGRIRSARGMFDADPDALSFASVSFLFGPSPFSLGDSGCSSPSGSQSITTLASTLPTSCRILFDWPGSWKMLKFFRLDVEGDSAASRRNKQMLTCASNFSWAIFWSHTGHSPSASMA